MPSPAEAKKFGRQRVKVVILHFGDDAVSPPDPQQRAEAKAINKRRGISRSGVRILSGAREASPELLSPIQHPYLPRPPQNAGSFLQESLASK